MVRTWGQVEAARARERKRKEKEARERARKRKMQKVVHPVRTAQKAIKRKVGL